MKQLLKFSATWCGPCKSLSALIEGVDFGIPIKEIDVDVDFEIAVKYNVRGVPTMILLDEGVERKRTSGVMQPEELKKWINE